MKGFEKSKSIAPEGYEFVANIGTNSSIEIEWLQNLDWNNYTKFDKAYDINGKEIPELKGLYRKILK